MATTTAQQLEHLDDTDAYATAWSDALAAVRNNSSNNNNNNNTSSLLSWGGRGQGGRGLGRRTYHDCHVSVEDVRLEYVGSRLLLENATLKLQLGAGSQDQQQQQRPFVYALVGPNGCGKSSLLRRLHAGKIPGFPPQQSTLYISSEDLLVVPNSTTTITASTWIGSRYRDYCHTTLDAAGRARIQELESAMDALELGDNDDAMQQRMEELADAMAALEQEQEEQVLLVGSVDNNDINQERDQSHRQVVIPAMRDMGIDDCANTPISKLTPGQKTKVTLALALAVCLSASCDILLLDEPTHALDVPGLLQLRQLIQAVTSSSSSMSSSNTHGNRRKPTTVLLVSHDIDFINDVVTDVMEFHVPTLTLRYYAGNYVDYRVQRNQEERHGAKQSAALDKKRQAMTQTLHHLAAQPTPKRAGGAKTKARQIASHKKKMNRELVVVVRDSSATTTSSSNIPTTHGSGLADKRKRLDQQIPDKAVQFNFRNCSSQWHEPLIVAMDVGHSFGLAMHGDDNDNEPNSTHETGATLEKIDDGSFVIKKAGFLFDCVDLCIEEGGIYNILGATGSGKSTLLQILAQRITPTEGKVAFALNVDVAWLDPAAHDQLIFDANANDDNDNTALAYLQHTCPHRTEAEIRAECTAFGLSPRQITTAECRCLSRGERARLAVVQVMLQHNHHPHVLVWDTPTSHLDGDSVEALAHGLQQWNGTVVLACHDAHLLRLLDAQCFVLIPAEGKLRRVVGGMDAYVRSFANNNKR